MVSMLALPIWIRILLQIKKGKNNISSWCGRYSRGVLNELQASKLIEIEEEVIRLTEAGHKVTEGVSYGFLEEL